MKLSDIKTLTQVSAETDIHIRTLQDRLKSKNLGMVDGVDYMKLGKGQATILSPQGIKKILKLEEKK